jgi:hypothetical protein
MRMGATVQQNSDGTYVLLPVPQQQQIKPNVSRAALRIDAERPNGHAYGRACVMPAFDRCASGVSMQAAYPYGAAQHRLQPSASPVHGFSCH